MRRNAFMGYLAAEIIVILLVMLSFRWIEDRQVAATFAGALFVILPLGMWTLELRHREPQRRLWLASLLQFWIFFALPIMGLRVFNWGVPFDQLSLFGIPGPFLHQWSSKSYMVMVGFTAWEAWKSFRSKATA